MTDSEGHKVVVCDNGTGFVKCGFAGANFPAHIFPAMVGRPILRAKSKEGLFCSPFMRLFFYSLSANSFKWYKIESFFFHCELSCFLEVSREVF